MSQSLGNFQGNIDGSIFKRNNIPSRATLVCVDEFQPINKQLLSTRSRTRIITQTASNGSK